jgi:hypothetical protein
MISEEKLGRLARAAIQRSVTQPRGSMAPQTMTEDANRYFRTPSSSDPRKTLTALMRSLRDERRRGLAGHWSYDLNRHIALAQAYAAELQNQRANTGSSQAAKKGARELLAGEPGAGETQAGDPSQ